MPSASLPSLPQFIDEELLRTPLMFDEVLQHTAEAVAAAAPRQTPQERMLAAEVREAVQLHRQAAIAGYCQVLREQAQQVGLASDTAATTARAPALSLVDEEAVAAEVALSRTVEAIASVAEYEIRELRTYTSALVGDVDLSRETNPFRPEAHARALRAAAQALPLTIEHQVMFMGLAAMPLARALRKAYAAATSRLEAQGVEPGAYRTIVLSPGARTRWSADATGRQPQADLQALRDSLPMPLDEGRAAAARPAAAPAKAPDPRRLELLTRLFDAMLTDRRLPPHTPLLLSRLQSAALRLVLHDESALDSYDHTLWRFIDRLAFLAGLFGPQATDSGQRLRQHLQTLVDALVGEQVQDSRLYHWGCERLNALERHRFEQQRAALQGELDQLSAAEPVPEASPAAPAAFDVGSLPTVPAALLQDRPPADDQAAERWVMAQQPGDWCRLFLDGDWRAAQLIGSGPKGELWLYAEADGRPWVLRRRALIRLQAEGLAGALRPRSLLERAARRVLKDLTPQAS